MESNHVNQLRQMLLESPEAADWIEADIEMIKQSDYIMTAFLSTNRDINSALKSAKRLYNWRKENKVTELKATSFPKEVHQSQCISVVPADRDHRAVFLLRLCFPSPPKFSYSLAVQYCIFAFENFFQIVLATSRKPGIIIDFADIRLDLTLIKEVTYILAYIYPPYAEYITFCNLNWSCQAIFQVIKRFLPSTIRGMVNTANQDFLNNLTEKAEDLPYYLGGKNCMVTYPEWLASPNFEEWAEKSDNLKTYSPEQLDEIIKFYRKNAKDIWTIQNCDTYNNNK